MAGVAGGAAMSRRAGGAARGAGRLARASGQPPPAVRPFAAGLGRLGCLLLLSRRGGH
jgi:hypothetical protein